MSQGTALLLLFVVLPVVLGAVVIAAVQRRFPAVPTEHLTSELLRDGTRANATLLDWRTPGQSFLDQRPMVTFRVMVVDREATEMAITQSVPRALLRRMKPGMPLQLRLSPDGTAGAVVLPDDQALG